MHLSLLYATATVLLACAIGTLIPAIPRSDAGATRNEAAVESAGPFSGRVDVESLVRASLQ